MPRRRADSAKTIPHSRWRLKYDKHKQKDRERKKKAYVSNDDDKDSRERRTIRVRGKKGTETKEQTERSCIRAQ